MFHELFSMEMWSLFCKNHFFFEKRIHEESYDFLRFSDNIWGNLAKKVFVL